METEANLLCVPMAALAEDGTNPAEGDTVEATIKATFVRSEGDNAYIKLTEVNDQPVEDESMETDGGADDQGMDTEGSAIRGRAEQSDQENGY